MFVTRPGRFFHKENSSKKKKEPKKKKEQPVENAAAMEIRNQSVAFGTIFLKRIPTAAGKASLNGSAFPQLLWSAGCYGQQNGGER